jgi:hypothetical protein
MTDPAYTIEYETRPGYLVARVSGPTDSVKIKLAYLAEVAAECRARGLRKLLIVESLGGVLPPAEVHKLGPQIPPLVKGLIVAFVDSDPAHHEINRMGESIAVDHGAVGRVFRALKDAEHWIAAVP